jgi:signal transduction histidine kinase/DNA-binding NarL/FixJ family response regulator
MQSIAHHTPTTDDNLRDLQSDMLAKASMLAQAVAYVWLLLHLWFLDVREPAGTLTSVLAPWAGLACLLASSLIAYSLKRRLELASSLVVAGLAGAVLLALVSYRSTDVAYLFVVPILFASVLIRPWMAFTVCAAASAALQALSRSPAGLAPGNMAAIVAVLLLTAVASYLFSRNLYVALNWTWNEWQRASRNEQEARERGAELRSALKSLDEASARLERSNYMLGLARDQAEDARRLKQQFAQTISHELRTPLNLIVGFSELMAQSPEYYGSVLPQPYLRDLSIIQRNARHLQALVDDVLDLARIDAAQMSVVLEEVAPGTLAEDAADIVRSLVESRGLVLQTEIAPDLPVLQVDAMRIRQVLVNLLNNAARFTEKGGITVSVAGAEQDVVFAVVDTGVGIAPDNLPKVFQEFQQVDGSPRRRHQGAGLGLAISRRFVEMHGGRIWVESQVNQGSTFRFSLPLAKPEMAPSGHPYEALRATSGDHDGAEVPVLLVVTRSPSAIGLLSRYVRGCRTVSAGSLTEAVAAARSLMPQVLVVDTASQGMPPAELEALLLECQLPYAMGIACPLPGEDTNRALLGAAGYLIKPVSRQALWDALRPFGESIDSILLVDDDRDFVRFMRRILQDPVRRYQVTSAYSGQEALDKIERQRPDLVLLDLMLPDLDGDQVIARVRENPLWADLPILIVSAQDEVEERLALSGPLVVAKGNGLLPSQTIRFIQLAIEASTRPDRPTAQTA